MLSLQGWVFNVIPWLVAIPSSLFSGCLSDHLISQGRWTEEQISELLYWWDGVIDAHPTFSFDPHRLWYCLSEEVDAGTVFDSFLVVLCLCYLFSLIVDFLPLSLKCMNVLFFLYSLVHNEWFKIICVFLCAFIPLLVFLHGCVQCVYPSSVWQHHLPLGCSICVCHHGPHYLQSQVPAPKMSSYSYLSPWNLFLNLNMVGLSVCFVLLSYFIHFLLVIPLHAFPSPWGQHHITAPWTSKCHHFFQWRSLFFVLNYTVGLTKLHRA